MLWPHNLLVLCPWFIECASNFYLDEQEAFILAFESSQQIKDGLEEVTQLTRIGGKYKRKMDATHIPSTLPIQPLVTPKQHPPPSIPIIQHDKMRNDLHPHELA